MNLLVSSDLDYCFWELQHKLSFDEIFVMIWAILETLLSRSDLRENQDAQGKIGSFVEKLIQVFSCLNTNSSQIRTKEIIKTSLDLINKSMISATQFNYGPIACNLIRFVRNFSHLPLRLLDTEAIETLSKVPGQNVLHEAIRFAECDDHVYATVRLLLYAGCDPNAIDRYGNTPLHSLANIDQRYLKGDLNTVAALLLDFGAQLSRKNEDGKTVADLFIWKNEINRNKNADQGTTSWNLPDWCTELPKLTYLCARVIRRSRTPHSELPVTLISMIEKHKILQ